MQYLRNASPSSQPDSKSLLLTGDVLEDNLFWVFEEQGGPAGSLNSPGQLNKPRPLLAPQNAL